MENKKGGITTNTVIGVGMLIVATIVIFVLVATLNNSNLFTDRSVTSVVTNESFSRVNDTLKTFGNSTELNAVCSIVYATNATDGELIDPGNYTVTNCQVKFSSPEASDQRWNDTVEGWNLTHSSVYNLDDSEELTTDVLRANFTGGVENVSNKVPTILLIIAVVFLFGALVLLMRQFKGMGISSSGGSL